MSVYKVDICGVTTSKLPVLKDDEKEELFEKIKNVRSGLQVELESGLKKQHKPTVLPQPASEYRYQGCAARSGALQALPPKQSA